MMPFVVYAEIGWGKDMKRRFICETNDRATAEEIALSLSRTSETGERFRPVTPGEWLMLEAILQNHQREDMTR